MPLPITTEINSFSLSRWRERVGVRVAQNITPSPLSSPPRGEEIRGYALLKLKECTFEF